MSDATTDKTIESEAGKLIVLSGPSGVGKSSIVKRMLADCRLPLELSVSATTRPPRPGEQDKVHYLFLSEEEFGKRRDSGEFLECCEVFGKGHWYGTLRESVAASLKQGKWVILEIDVQGAMKVLEQEFPEVVTIFVRPDNIEELERRLRGRDTESEESIQKRLERARHELAYAEKYQHCLVNDTLDQTVDEICQLLNEVQQTIHGDRSS